MKNIQLSEINNLLQVSKVLAESPFYQKLGASGVLAIYLTAVELGLPVMYCLNGGLYNVEGRVTLSANAINMMMINAGWKIEFLEMSDTACHLRFISPDNRSVNEFRYTIEEAKKAGYFGVMGLQGVWEKKPKQNWLYFTKDMLFNRCVASGGRKFAPHVIGNLYVEGEIGGEELSLTYEPEIQNKTIQNKESKNIDFKPVDDVEQFKKRHNISEGEQVYDFVMNIASTKKMEPEQVIAQSFLDEKKFLDCFQRFKEKSMIKEQIA